MPNGNHDLNPVTPNRKPQQKVTPSLFSASPNSLTLSQITQDFFGAVAANFKIFLGILVLLILMGCLVAFFLNQSQSNKMLAQNALYLAEKEWERELKQLGDKLEKKENPQTANSEDLSSKPTKSSKTKSVPAKSGSQSPSKDQKQPNAALENLAFKKLDVGREFPNSIKMLKGVVQDFPNTRASKEAMARLAGNYLNHGGFQDAQQWYEKLTQNSKTGYEGSLAWFGLGASQESNQKYTDALKSYEKAQQLDTGELKGHLLLAVARVYELMKDLIRAKSTYDQILTQLPNSEYSKSAEIFKSMLE